MIEKIKRKIKTLKPDELYSPSTITDMGLIVNTKLVPSIFTVHRLIRTGQLPAVDMGAGKHARHFVKGKDLIKFLKETYQI